MNNIKKYMKLTYNIYINHNLYIIFNHVYLYYITKYNCLLYIKLSTILSPVNMINIYIYIYIYIYYL